MGHPSTCRDTLRERVRPLSGCHTTLNRVRKSLDRISCLTSTDTRAHPVASRSPATINDCIERTVRRDRVIRCKCRYPLVTLSLQIPRLAGCPGPTLPPRTSFAHPPTPNSASIDCHWYPLWQPFVA